MEVTPLKNSKWRRSSEPFWGFQGGECLCALAGMKFLASASRHSPPWQLPIRVTLFSSSEPSVYYSVTVLYLKIAPLPKKPPCQHVCIRCSLVGTPVLQTAAMLDCLVTIKAAMNVLQKSKNEIALVENDTTISLLQRFVKVIVDVLKNGRIDFFSKIHHIFIFLSRFGFIQPQC